MNTIKILSFLIAAFILSSCASNNSTAKNSLYGVDWQLDYISGPRIAFDGLYPDKKPQISFNKENNRVEGSNSCNGYSADFKVDGNAVTFGEPGMSTMMYCGEGEGVFLNTVKKINRYSIDGNGQLNLLIDDVAVMRFTKIN